MRVHGRTTNRRIFADKGIVTVDASVGQPAPAIRQGIQSQQIPLRLSLGVQEPADGPAIADQTQKLSPKELGAYYTDATIARFLLRWAVVRGQETVLDPSFGGGVFLLAAAERIAELGGNPARQVYGIELDPPAYQAFASRCVGDQSLAELRCANFFEIRTDQLPAADAVVGNPPFIRYQRFNGGMRLAALRRARQAGVDLSQLTSSWAPFMVHAGQFVKPGGRLAMVAPAELGHAAYARPVLSHLCRSFRTVEILSFKEKLFSALSEDTVLVLAAGRGEPFQRLALTDLPGLEALERCSDPSSDLPAGTPVDATSVGQGHERLLHYLLPTPTRQLYRQLRDSSCVARLGDLADVGIGYVTGANDFFHVDKETVAAHELPQGFLRPAVRSGSDLSGLRFAREDWEALYRAGSANQLLYIPNAQPLPGPIEAYLSDGESEGIRDRYKCRAREPWYRVPNVYEADAFLTYMSGSVPKLVANEADAVAPNTLHIVRLQPLQLRASLSALGLAALWQTSLTALSCELEGHSLGGGMLKLEPTEAERVAIALPGLQLAKLQELARELDGLLRAGEAGEARELADRVVLRCALGLSPDEVDRLRAGWLLLQARRLNR